MGVFARLPARWRSEEMPDDLYIGVAIGSKVSV